MTKKRTDTLELIVSAGDNSINHMQSRSYVGGLMSNEREVVLPRVFYAVLQFRRSHRLRSGNVWWFQDVAGKPGYSYPINDSGLHDILTHVEPQGIGLFDGKWELRKHGGYVTVYPVITEQ